MLLKLSSAQRIAQKEGRMLRVPCANALSGCPSDLIGRCFNSTVLVYVWFRSLVFFIISVIPRLRYSLPTREKENGHDLTGRYFNGQIIIGLVGIY